MRIDYSKPSADIQKEVNVRLQNDKELFERQFSESQRLLSCEDRKECALCARPLVGEMFNHRDIPFVMCATCSHVQTKAMPPADYPNISFNAVYPASDAEAYRDRKARIYKPKLDWIISCLKELQYSPDTIKQMKWVEMGAGAGYFISCLAAAGIKDITGIDSDKKLVEIANTFTHGNRVHYYSGRLSDAFEQYPADIYVAFFVLEHIFDTHEFFLKIKSLPPQTIFIFSVPVFGFSCLLENIFKNNYARNLDAVIHTQLYTDNSIAYAAAEAGYEILAQWIFGQDATDFTRFMLHNLSENFSEQLLKKLGNYFTSLQDPLQHCLDSLKLADQRHIIIKKNKSK